jgi:hypothetical protein
VEKGEKPILPKGAAHWQEHEALVAIYPIFIAVGLRQNCKQNYIFITVTFPYGVTKISPGLLYNLAKISLKSRRGCTKISPKSRQNLAKISPGLLHNLAKISPGLHYDLAKISPGLHYDLAKILPKSRHSCSTMSPRLAELQYDLATVAVGSPQDWQNCYTISPQLHYDVPKTPRIAVRFRHSCTTMFPRLAGLLYDIATVELRCPY